MTEPLRRGDVVWADLGAAGAPLKKRRLLVIVQNDIGNLRSPHTIVAAIRHDTGKALPIHAALPAGTAGFPKDSVVDAGILMTVSAASLARSGRRLDAETMRRIDRALAVSLGLERP